MRRNTIAIRSAFVLIGFLTMLGITGPSVAAQNSEIPFRIYAFACESDPGNVSVPAGNIPETCDPVEGVTYNVATADGTTIGSCTTDASGMCSLQAPNEEDVTVTDDASTRPTGYAPRENPISTTAVTEFAGTEFYYLPETTDLPDTGIGLAPSTTDYTLVSVTAAAVLCGSTALLIRHRIT